LRWKNENVALQDKSGDEAKTGAVPEEDDEEPVVSPGSGSGSSSSDSSSSGSGSDSGNDKSRD